MMNFKNFTKRLVKNQKGQGATEYILLLVVVVALVTMFKSEIQTIVKDKISALQQSITQVQ